MNDQTLPPQSAAGPDDFDRTIQRDSVDAAIENALDANTISLANIGATIKQAPPVALGATADSPAPVSTIAGEGGDDDGRTLVRPAGAFGTPVATDSGGAGGMTVTVAPPQGGDEGRTIARPGSVGGMSASQGVSGGMGATLSVASDTGQTMPSQGGGARPAASAASFGSGSFGGRSRSQQSASVSFGASTISINIRPRNITKSLNCKTINYAAAGEEAVEDAADFELLEQLGEGGMGVVYSARQSSIDRDIALKMIKGKGSSNDQVRAKFLQEAVVTGDLDHPNIVTIHDLGADASGNVFYAMQKVSGTEWAEVLKEKTLNENLDILLRVADAIAFAHSKGVIHRDLKPENTMLGSFGEVLVMDWGLAVAVSDEAKAERVSAATGIAGTPAYLAPEMAAPGGWKELGFCSDIYLLGAILFEIITGQRPHTGKNVGECLKNAAKNIIRETGVQGELMDIALKAMATKPADRYESVKDLQKAIREYLSHSESNVLSERARADLETASRSGSYDDYAKALFGFRQAVELWEGNFHAREGVINTVRMYGRAALNNGDLDLASSLVTRDNFAECAELAAEIVAAQEHRAAQVRRNKVLRAGVAVLSVAVLVISVIAALWINAERKEAITQRDVATKEKERANLEKERADAEKKVAVAERDRANVEMNRANTEMVRANKERDRANEQSDIAEKNRKEAINALRAMTEAKTKEELERARRQAAEVDATVSKAEIQTRDQLNADKWWTFDAATAKKRQDEAAAKLGTPALREIDLGAGQKLALALIPATAEDYGMGSRTTEGGRLSEENLHRVKISKPFYLATHELTEAQLAAIMGTGAPATDGKLPASDLSWNDVREKILPRLTQKAPQGWKFRLPSEAEWEWACRAGTDTEYYAGNGVKALQTTDFTGADNLVGPAATGKRAPNAWGLFDLHGNMAEWCQDSYQKDVYFVEAKKVTTDPLVQDPALSKRVVRGGSWANLEKDCRSAHRSYANPDSRYKFIGVRLALVKE